MQTDAAMMLGPLCPFGEKTNPVAKLGVVSSGNMDIEVMSAVWHCDRVAVHSDVRMSHA